MADEKNIGCLFKKMDELKPKQKVMMLFSTDSVFVYVGFPLFWSCFLLQDENVGTPLGLADVQH